MTASGFLAASSFVMAEDVSSFDHWGGSPCTVSLGTCRGIGRAYGEATRDGVEADVNLVHKVCWL